MKQCFSASAQMNSSNTNEGGWGASRMRSTTVPSYLTLLPAELQATNGIKAVNKVNNKGANPTSDRLWPGSEYEILGVTSYSGTQEGVKYTRSSNIFTQNGSACGVWAALRAGQLLLQLLCGHRVWGRVRWRCRLLVWRGAGLLYLIGNRRLQSALIPPLTSPLGEATAGENMKGTNNVSICKQT